MYDVSHRTIPRRTRPIGVYSLYESVFSRDIYFRNKTNELECNICSFGSSKDNITCEDQCGVNNVDEPENYGDKCQDACGVPNGNSGDICLETTCANIRWPIVLDIYKQYIDPYNARTDPFKLPSHPFQHWNNSDVTIGNDITHDGCNNDIECVGIVADGGTYKKIQFEENSGVFECTGNIILKDACGVLNGTSDCLDDCGVPDGDNDCLKCYLPNGLDNPIVDTAINDCCYDNAGICNGERRIKNFIHNGTCDILNTVIAQRKAIYVTSVIGYVSIIDDSWNAGGFSLDATTHDNENDAKNACGSNCIGWMKTFDPCTQTVNGLATATVGTASSVPMFANTMNITKKGSVQVAILNMTENILGQHF